MLVEIKELHGFKIHASDGEIGRVDDILFDDEHWTVRYLVVNTGGWLSDRKVLISPISFGGLVWDQRIINLKLTREQIENSPGVETDEPVSRQWERNYYRYYSLPYYWGGMGVWGANWYPGDLYARPVGAPDEELAADEREPHEDNPYLRSAKEVSGYGISAKDGHIGHIKDFIVNDETWRIDYIEADTQDWLPGKKVALSPSWIESVSWPERSVAVNVTREQVENAPEWEHGQPVSEDFEKRFYSHYEKDRPSAKTRLNAEVLEKSERVTEKLTPSAFQNQGESVEKSTVVAIYDTHGEAEASIRKLQKMGFEMSKLSIVGKDYHTSENVVGYYNTGDRMKSWGATGAFWSGIWSLMFGSAFFLIPGIGPILAAGPVVVWIVGALESAVVVGGLSALGAALFSIGIPENSIIEYETQLKAGKFVLIYHGSADEAEKTRAAFDETNHLGVRKRIGNI